MRFSVTSLSCIFLAGTLLFISSCSKKADDSTVALYSIPILKDPMGISIGNMRKGNTVQYLGEKSQDSLLFKIQSGDVVGWVPWWSVALKAKPAVAVTDQIAVMNPGESYLFRISAHQLVAVDSVAGEWTRIQVCQVKGGKSTGWVPSTSVSADPADVTLAENIEKASALPAAEKAAQYQQLLKDNAARPLIAIVNVNLSKAPDDFLRSLAAGLNLLPDKNANHVTMVRNDVATYISQTANEIAGTVVGEDSSPYPISNYYRLFVSQLPQFLINGTRAPYEVSMPEDHMFKAFILSQVDRSPENIKKLYDTYRDAIVFGLKGNGAGDYIKTLITVHDHIVGLPNYKKVSANILKAVAEHDKTAEDTGYRVIEQVDIYEPLYHQPTFEKYDPRMDTRGIWFHSFWVRRIAEGNDEVVYTILKDLANEIPPSALDGEEVYGQEGYGDEPYADGDAEYGDYDDGLTTSICTFQDYSIGDCGHMMFDCGDLGDADTQNLSEEDQKLWNDLVLADTDGERGNPEYVGKQFEIKMGTTTGPACNEGQGGEGQVPQLHSFRLVTQ